MLRICTGAPFEVYDIKAPEGEFLTTRDDSGVLIVESSKGSVRELFTDVISVFDVDESREEDHGLFGQLYQ